MTNDRMALLELIEKGADADLIRELLAFASQRLMAAEVDQLTGFTTDEATLVAAIDGMENITGTALYDGIVEAAGLLEGAEGIHSIVVFADGEDNASESTYEDAVVAAEAVDADITVAILDSPTLDATTLENQLDKHVAIFMGIVDLSSNELLYANAGHYPSAILVDTEGARLL
jgi:hypothetical protein